MNFYACSVGQPDKGYDEENLKRIISKNAFILHEDTNQKGVYENIAAGDILLLKFRNNFIAYGEATGREITNEEGWNLTAPVIEWYFKDPKNPKVGEGTYGIQENTIEGAGQMGTVKEIDEKFGIEKLKNIDDSSLLYKKILMIIENRKKMITIQTISDLLDYKKQIILQGPPGTGKTRLAKEIAKELIKPKEITKEDILSCIKIGLEIISITDYAKYNVTNISETNITLQLQSGTTQTPTFQKIIEGYRTKIWNGGTKGGDAYIAAIAKYIYENILPQNQYKIIQFHPAYSYEDFVRGISAKSNGTNIEYKTENKILANFAKEALENYTSSKKQPEELSKEIWFKEQFEELKNKLQDEISKNSIVYITQSVYIFEVDDDAFRYKGDNWLNPSRIIFEDFKTLFLAEIKEKKDIEANLNISKHVKYRSTYYLALKDYFQTNLPTKWSPSLLNDKKIKQLNYILIIDEINRANLPSVLGELIYALEYRNEPVESMYELESGSKKIILPPNLYIIGTMNTADRSVGHIDYAIRRRFAFVDVLPTKEAIENVIKNSDLKERAKKLFDEVAKLFIEKNVENSENKVVYLQSDFKAKDVQLGHSYFLVQTVDELNLKLEYEIKPLLYEYIKDGILSEQAKIKIDELS